MQETGDDLRLYLRARRVTKGCRMDVVEYFRRWSDYHHFVAESQAPSIRRLLPKLLYKHIFDRYWAVGIWSPSKIDQFEIGIGNDGMPPGEFLRRQQSHVFQ